MRISIKYKGNSAFEHIYQCLAIDIQGSFVVITREDGLVTIYPSDIILQIIYSKSVEEREGISE